MSLDNFHKAAEITKTKLYQKVVKVDPETGRETVTPVEFPIYEVPVRVFQQFADKGMSVPSAKETVDALTGQVVGDSRASAVSNPEIQALYIRGLENSIVELVKVRGGDMNAYSEFIRQLEETGEASLGALSPSKTRTVVMTDVFFKGMGIDTNLSKDF
jgi:hypothetical protein